MSLLFYSYSTEIECALEFFYYFLYMQLISVSSSIILIYDLLKLCSFFFFEWISTGTVVYFSFHLFSILCESVGGNVY